MRLHRTMKGLVIQAKLDPKYWEVMRDGRKKYELRSVTGVPRLRFMRGFEFRSPDGRLLGSVYTGPARTLVKGEDGRWRDAQGSPVREGMLCHLDGITRGEFDRLFAGSTILLLFPILKTRRARMVHHADVLVGEV